MAFDWTSLLGSVSGGALGFIGACAQKILAMREAKQTHGFKIEELKLSQQIDAEKAAALFEQIKEKGASDAFTASIQAEGNLAGSYPWVNATMKLWRPGLTVFLVTITHITAIWAGQETRDYLLLCDVSMASGALGYWFGQRTFDKVPTRIAKK
jgi:hypothetical protein